MIDSSDKQYIELHTHYRRMGRFLTAGTVISLLLMTAGLVIFAVKNTSHMISLTPSTSLIPSLLLLSPDAIVTLGLYVIFLMPAAVLLASLLYFIRMHETRPLIACILLIVMMAASYIFILK